jgi:hypothetical protein
VYPERVRARTIVAKRLLGALFVKVALLGADVLVVLPRWRWTTAGGGSDGRNVVVGRQWVQRK